MNNKVIALIGVIIAALLALSVLARFVLLSQYGFGVPPFFYVGLPIGGISLVVLLLRLGVFNFGERPGGTIRHWQQPGGVQPSPHQWQQPGGVQPHPPAFPPAPASAPSAAPKPPSPLVYRRLQELETLRATGAISENEYTAQRQQIISTM